MSREHKNRKIFVPKKAELFQVNQKTFVFNYLSLLLYNAKKLRAIFCGHAETLDEWKGL